ncbi:MAG TPA: di-heme oxidoredictase family protein [Blastocatellia bacterium]
MKRIKTSVFLIFLATLLPSYISNASQAEPATEAPAAFDGLSNGYIESSAHAIDRLIFEERETKPEGLGPIYNAQSCAECHQNPLTGGSSQVSVLRAGRLDSFGNFIEPPGGSLIHDRAVDPAIQEKVHKDLNVRTLRVSLSLLGAGFVEAIGDSTLEAVASSQPAGLRGELIQVPVLESPGATRAGRFGWKAQHASLLSFSADAYLNEMGITNQLFPEENTSMGQSVAAFDTVADPEDVDNEIEAFARFIRATKAPPRDEARAATPDAQAGAELFDRLKCNVCHVPSITTAPGGTVINGGAFIVPPALGNKIIHPYGDYLLHDVGTGDGIVQNGPVSTRNKMRTAPLWGLRTRSRYMHDGASLTVEEAILRHGGQAAAVTEKFRSLSRKKKNRLLAFLDSL